MWYPRMATDQAKVSTEKTFASLQNLQQEFVIEQLQDLGQGISQQLLEPLASPYYSLPQDSRTLASETSVWICEHRFVVLVSRTHGLHQRQVVL